jgi:hypothetical protein
MVNKSKTTMEMSLGSGSRLRMPLQAPPVNRTMGGSALAAGSGVDPSWGWSDLGDLLKQAGPYIAKAAPYIAAAL